MSLHFPDLQKSYCAALERRETVLLTLLDRQVELKQDMIEEARTEVAAARARILAAKEEGQLDHSCSTLGFWWLRQESNSLFSRNTHLHTCIPEMHMCTPTFYLQLAKC